MVEDVDVAVIHQVRDAFIATLYLNILTDAEVEEDVNVEEDKSHRAATPHTKS